jgi:hypothetical protein
MLEEIPIKFCALELIIITLGGNWICDLPKGFLMVIQNVKVLIDLRRGKFQYIPNEKINLKYLGCFELSHNAFLEELPK